MRMKVLGLKMADLFPHQTHSNGRGSGGASPMVKPVRPLQGLDLLTLAAAKQLPVEHLQALNLTTIPNYNGAPAVRIPYHSEDGSLRATRYRIALDGDRFRWKRADRPALYGLDRLA